MKFDIITIFPEVFTSYFTTSIMKRAQEKSGEAGSPAGPDRASRGGSAGKPLVTIAVHNLRDYTTDKHRTVDDSPYGGGAGMVMKVEPIWRAVRAIVKRATADGHRQWRGPAECGDGVPSKGGKTRNVKRKVILLAASGKQFDQRMAEKFSKLDQIIFICGHYEGVDERVMNFVDEAVSVGPYVLTGGELPTMTIVDAVTRLIPGVLGNPRSLDEESFGLRETWNVERETKKTLRDPRSTMREYPHYTRPEAFSPRKNVHWKVPKVLLGGNHEKIAQWRQKRMK